MLAVNPYTIYKGIGRFDGIMIKNILGILIGKWENGFSQKRRIFG
jgi:hypothetical protein